MGLITALDRLQEAIGERKEALIQDCLRRFAPDWLRADHLTFFRLAAAIVAITFVAKDTHLVAGIFFVGGAFTDILDGPLARMRGEVTDRGAFLDGFADKVLCGLTLITIFVVQEQDIRHISDLLFYLVIGTDIFLVALWFLGKTIPHQVGLRRRLGANSWGRQKAVIESAGIAFLLFAMPAVGGFLLWIAVALAVVSIYGHVAFRGAP